MVEEHLEALAAEQPRQLAAALAEAAPALQRLAQRLCGNTAEAHDLVQDTFERAMRRGLAPEIRSPGAWLASIMHNLFIDRCRRSARRPPPMEFKDAYAGAAPQLESSGSEPAWTQITMDDIRDALDQIEPMFREPYVKHAFDRLSYEQIAQQLSIAPLTVGTRLWRARKRLREVLAKRFGLEGAS